MDNIKKNELKNLTSVEKDIDIFLNNCEEKFNALLEIAEDLIFLLDKNGCFILINKNGALALDYPSGKILRKHFLEFVDYKKKPATLKAFHKILDSQEIISFETTLINKYGNEIIFEINGKSIINNGKIIGMFGAGKNISEQRSIEYELKQLSNKLIEAERLISIERSRSKKQKSILDELNLLKSEFITNISHELRTPLSSIVGFSEAIFSDPEMSFELKKEFNGIILKEGKRLAKLIDDVLDISRAEQGNIKLNKSEFDCNKLIKEIIEEYKSKIFNKNINLSYELPEDQVIIEGDRERIAKAVSVLLDNSVKYTLPGGRLKIIAQDLINEYEVIISDTGVGIPEKEISFIFDKFYKINRTGMDITNSQLGLVFVKQIVDLHNGFITVQSEKEKGTSFLIKFPKL